MFLRSFAGSRGTAQSGQIGLVVLLGMVVIATIGISVATRSTQDLTSSRQDQETSQTFSAAESALERILAQGSDETFNFSGDTREFNRIVSSENTSADVSIQKEFTFDNYVRQAEVVEVDVSEPTHNRTLVVEWSTSRDCAENPASLIVTVFSNNASARTRNFAFGPCSHGDNFELVNPSQSANHGTTFALKRDIPLQNGDQKVRIRPAYADTNILVRSDGSWNLTAQQFTITSVGRNETEGGRETRAIQLERTQPFAPGVLDFAIVSGTDINKEL